MLDQASQQLIADAERKIDLWNQFWICVGLLIPAAVGVYNLVVSLVPGWVGLITIFSTSIILTVRMTFVTRAQDELNRVIKAACYDSNPSPQVSYFSEHLIPTRRRPVAA